MIIVLDSSALTRGVRFDTAIADARALGHRVVVPRLVVLEVASRYREESAEMIAALSVQARMLRPTGIAARPYEVRRRCSRQGRRLRRRRDRRPRGDRRRSGRSSRRVACRGGREGDLAASALYRQEEARRISGDAELADRARSRRRNPGVDVIWVSSDARAYGDGEDGVWHGDLARELASARSEYRVRWASDIPVIDGPVQAEQVAEVEEAAEVAPRPRLLRASWSRKRWFQPRFPNPRHLQQPPPPSLFSAQRGRELRRSASNPPESSVRWTARSGQGHRRAETKGHDRRRSRRSRPLRCLIASNLDRCLCCRQSVEGPELDTAGRVSNRRSSTTRVDGCFGPWSGSRR